MFPLSSLRSMAMFRFTGLFAFLCIMFVSGAIVYEGIRSIISDGGQIHPNMVYFNFSMDGVFSALPVIGFAYVFHTSFFPIWKSMKDPADKKISVASYVAIALVCLIYVSISTFGYIHFLSKTERNIMKNFPPSNILMIVAKIGYLLVVLCAYPINCFVLRESVDKIFFTGPAPFWRRTLLAFLLTTAALVLAVVIPNLSFVLGLAGALPGAFLSFVFPALFYIILVDNRSSVRRFLACLCSFSTR
jgi:solute carrier family 38 (sodium-coupled neutral amino acid transporter), member 11